MQTIKNICDLTLHRICFFFAFVYESDYRMAYIAFFVFWYDLFTMNTKIFTDVLMLEMFVCLFIIRKLNEISDRIDAFYKIFDGTQIKRIEMEINCETRKTENTD